MNLESIDRLLERWVDQLEKLIDQAGHSCVPIPVPILPEDPSLYLARDH